MDLFFMYVFKIVDVSLKNLQISALPLIPKHTHTNLFAKWQMSSGPSGPLFNILNKSQGKKMEYIYWVLKASFPDCADGLVLLTDKSDVI